MDHELKSNHFCVTDELGHRKEVSFLLQRVLGDPSVPGASCGRSPYACKGWFPVCSSDPVTSLLVSLVCLVFQFPDPSRTGSSLQVQYCAVQL